MMACFGSVAHAPLAVMIMVAEMTGSFSVIPGAMIAVGIAYLIVLAHRCRSTGRSGSIVRPPPPSVGVILCGGRRPDDDGGTSP